MATYEFELVKTLGKTVDEKTMSVDTLYNAQKYACWWIDGREGYFVHLSRKNKYGNFEYITPITYRDGVYYKGVFKNPINPRTGRPIRKKSSTSKTNGFGLARM